MYLVATNKKLAQSIQISTDTQTRVRNKERGKLDEQRRKKDDTETI